MAAPADGPRVLTRLRKDESGFGLVELTFSMVLLSISLLALVAAFSSGAVTLKRAARVATATALGERQMELYRGLKYAAIGLAPGLVTSADATWTATRRPVATMARTASVR